MRFYQCAASFSLHHIGKISLHTNPPNSIIVSNIFDRNAWWYFIGISPEHMAEPAAKPPHRAFVYEQVRTGYTVTLYNTGRHYDIVTQDVIMTWAKFSHLIAMVYFKSHHGMEWKRAPTNTYNNCGLNSIDKHRDYYEVYKNSNGMIVY